ncbi:MAG TPA: 50S ribosomal protein L10 [Bacteroidales bacterium]|nr:50S ribosomal protein L10 [Bacteroidales bacterium]
MTREDKNNLIDVLVEKINNSNHFYLTDIDGLNAVKTAKLRELCNKKEVELLVVKNTLLQKALERLGSQYDELHSVLKGSTSVMFCESANVPAKLIKEFSVKNKKPILKGAYVEESTYIGANQLEALINVKSKEELIGDIVLLLQSPMKTVLGQLQSGGNIIHGVLKTLSEKNN